MQNKRLKEIMVATLGVEPQVITIALDQLLDSKFSIRAEFINHWLSPSLWQVEQHDCLGLDNAAIAKALNKKEQTVANQFGEIYEKLQEWLDYPSTKVDRSVLNAQFAPYFALMEEDNYENR